MASPSRITRNRFHGVEKELSARRAELMARLARQRSEVFEEPEPDDEGAEANRNLARHMVLATLDRERRTLTEIEFALKRLKSGEYGICNTCGDEIPDARLRALPWAHFCLKCAERSATA